MSGQLSAPTVARRGRVVWRERDRATRQRIRTRRARFCVCVCVCLFRAPLDNSDGARAEFAKQPREHDEEGIVRYLVEVIRDGPIEKKIIALEIVYNMISDAATR